MNTYKYLIIGGGMAAGAAIKGIRELDPEASIGIVGDELDPPYKRPPLSKKLWQGKPLKIVWGGMDVEGVGLHLGRRAVLLDARQKQVTDDANDTYAFDKLLIATGGRPRRLPFDDEDVIYFRTLEDYRRLRARTEAGNDFAVVGGGFIGSELAAALAMNGKHVTLVLPGSGIGEKIYPAGLVRFLGKYYSEKGVDLLPGDRAVGLRREGERTAIRLQSGRELLVDGVVAGIGIEPNVAIALSAGLETGNGIIVDEYLRTSHPDIYAAGDVASYPDYSLRTRRRVEHEDNARSMGRAAGRAMAGAPEPYRHLPTFYSDMFDLGYEAVGELDSSLETVSDWLEPYRKGVVYYMREGRVRGVLLWNVWGQVEAASRLVAEPGPFRAEDLMGRLPVGTE